MKITAEMLFEALSKGAVYGAFIEDEEPYVVLDGVFDLEEIAKQLNAEVTELET